MTAGWETPALYPRSPPRLLELRHLGAPCNSQTEENKPAPGFCSWQLWEGSGAGTRTGLQEREHQLRAGGDAALSRRGDTNQLVNAASDTGWQHFQMGMFALCWHFLS